MCVTCILHETCMDGCVDVCMDGCMPDGLMYVMSIYIVVPKNIQTKIFCYGQHQLRQRIKHESAICRVHPLDIVMNMKHTVSLQPWFTRKFTQVLSFAETCARSMFETYIPSCHQHGNWKSPPERFRAGEII